MSPCNRNRRHQVR